MWEGSRKSQENFYSFSIDGSPYKIPSELCPKKRQIGVSALLYMLIIGGVAVGFYFGFRIGVVSGR